MLWQTQNLEELNAYLKENNWKMNGSGGEIKGTPEHIRTIQYFGWFVYD
jgi:hypothetical protein